MRLRPLTKEDSNAVYQTTHDDWTIHHALMNYFCETTEYAKQFVSQLLNDPKNKSFAILSENDAFAGVLTLYFHNQSTIEISSYISKKHRGKRYAYLSLQQIFQQYPGYRMLFDVAPDNWRSLSIMEKIGAYKLNDDYYFVDTW